MAAEQEKQAAIANDEVTGEIVVNISKLEQFRPWGYATVEYQ